VSPANLAGFLLFVSPLKKQDQKSKTKKLLRMKTIFTKLLIVVLAVLSLNGCSRRRNNAPMMKNVTGRAGEMVVVMNSEAWKGTIGDSTRALLAQPQLGLPQNEPLFDLISIPPEAFGDIFKTTRAIFIARISPSVEESGIQFQNDLHAYLQSVVTITAKNQNEFLDILKKNNDRIIAYFLTSERRRLMYNYSRYFERAISNRTKEKFNININVPPGFVVSSETEDFMWIRYETPDISQAILIYTFPYESDSTFTNTYMTQMRNRFTRANVPGSIAGSYMVIEDLIPSLFNITRRNGNYASELRGLWRLENDFMGGPFVNLAILDMLNNRVVVLDGFVYAPSKDKRNLLRQVEAMIYSAEFTNQADIDKVNKQLE
jgi:hypothetical protein